MGRSVWPGRRQRWSWSLWSQFPLRGTPDAGGRDADIGKPPAVEPQDLPARRGVGETPRQVEVRAPARCSAFRGAGRPRRLCNHVRDPTTAPGSRAGAAAARLGKSCEHPPVPRSDRPGPPRAAPPGVESRVQGWGTKKRQRADSFVTFSLLCSPPWLSPPGLCCFSPW